MWKTILRPLFVATLTMATPVLGAEKVVKVMENGTSAARVDLVILGDGYTQAELNAKKFENDAKKFIDSFFAETPFKQYKKSFNVWRIDTPSTTSTIPKNGKPGNTVYGAYFYCFGLDRLLCIEPGRVDGVLSRTNMTGTKADIVIVIVDSKTYGGSGGKYAVTSTEATAGQIALHELGHSFGLLDDEYVDSASCNGGNPPYAVRYFNVTKTKSRASIPWTKWIAASTPVPTPFNFSIPQDKPGLYEGAFFCNKGWFRPTPNSKMNALGAPFYAINGEQLIRRIYAFTDVIASTTPKAGSVTIPKAGSQKFAIKPRNAGLTTLKYTWRVNGVVKSTTNSITIAGNSFGATTTLDLTVQDKTPMVRKDTAKALIDTASWTLKRGS